VRISELTAREDLLTKKDNKLDTKSFKPKAKIVCKPARADNDKLTKDNLFDDAEFTIERELTKGEEKNREKTVKSLKKDKAGFKKRYGKDWESVMYGTATNIAKKK
jgi:hypothetical protein